MTATEQRAALTALAQARRLSLAALSVMLRRNPAYLQQFVARGTPRVLAERDRRSLADVFGVDDAALGGGSRTRDGARPEAFRIPRLDVAASAGPGTLVDDDIAIGTETLSPALARDLGLRAGQAGVIRVRGTSMEPTLRDGDHLVVDQADRSPKAKSAIYVIRVDGTVMVKRVVRTRAGLLATSDNPVASPVSSGAVDVIGRVVWRMGLPE